jgi:phosphoglycerate dehydrogenase-like enzyme
MKIVVLEPLAVSENELEALFNPLREEGHRITICEDRSDDPAENIRRAGDADVAVIANMPFPKDVLEKLPQLKMISVAFTGVDHVDLAVCRRRNIVVCNARGYATDSVAELAFGLIIGVLRKITLCDQAGRQGKTRAGLTGNRLARKTLGIVGVGAIGMRVAEIGKAFGCRLLGYNASRREDAAERIGLEYVSLEELLCNSDIVSLHLPLTDSTRLLINRDRLALMKPAAILINTARGPIVDSEALAEALASGRLGGAGIDVFEMEPPIPASHPLLSCPNVMVTPHVAYATDEAFALRARIAVDNIVKWLTGAPQNIIS